MKTALLEAVVSILKRPIRRPKSIKRFAVYRNGMTLAEFIKAGGTPIQLNYDRAHSFVQLTDPETKGVLKAKIMVRDVRESKVATDKAVKAKKSDSSHYELRKLKAPKSPKKSSAKARKSA